MGGWVKFEFILSTKAALLASTSPLALLSDIRSANGDQTVLPFALESIVQDMWRAFQATLYYPALLVALTLPEVCSGLTLSANLHVNKNHYVSFIDQYARLSNLGLDGAACYQMRGGMVHRGNASGHSNWGGGGVVFTVPETHVEVHGVSLMVGDQASSHFDLRTFCQAMDDAVRRWYRFNKNDETVVATVDSLLCWRPNGLAPFLVGSPVVASLPLVSPVSERPQE